MSEQTDTQHPLPLVTIITPSFNQGRFLKDCLESVRAQSGVNIEHILLDGGSTDETLEVIKDYGQHLAYWNSARDDGQTAALVSGFAMAKGSIFGWLNADDYLWDENAIRQIAEAMRDYPSVDIVTGDMVCVSEDKTPIMMNMFWNPKPRHLRYCMVVGQPSTYWRRSAYEQVGGLDPSFEFTMDYDLLLRMSKNSPIKRIPQIISAARFHKASKTSRLVDIAKNENNRCLLRENGKLEVSLESWITWKEIRIRSLFAEFCAIAKGRKLPSYYNTQIEDLRQSPRYRGFV